jgi:hypothetical protein
VNDSLADHVPGGQGRSSQSRCLSCLSSLSAGRVAVRESKDREGSALVYTPREWDAFLTGAKDGEFDLP